MSYLSLALAEFDYEATNAEEISVQEGQLVWVLENDDTEWWKVKVKSTDPTPTIGLVPASYLTSPPPFKTVHALYDYNPARTDSGELENEEELEVVEGEELDLWETDGDWYLVGKKGENAGVGFVPGTYVGDGDEDEAAAEEEEEAAAPAAEYVDPAERVAATKPVASKAGDVKTWSVTEMDKKKKKKKGTLGVGNGAIFFASESDKNPVQQYPLSALTDLTSEKSKHLHLTFPTAGELHFVIGTKEAFDEIVAKIEEGRDAAPPTSAPSPPPVVASPPPTAYTPPPPPLAQRPTPTTFHPPPPKRTVVEAAPVAPSLPSRSPSTNGVVGGGDGDCVALYDFEGEGDDELNVTEGDRLVFIPGGSDADPDWVKVRKVGSMEEGVVPASYVQLDEGVEGGSGAADPEEELRLAAEAEAEAAAEAADAKRLQAQIIADRAAADRAAKLKAAKDEQRRKEATLEQARKKRLSAAPPPSPIPIPTPQDVDDPPPIAARPGRDSRQPSRDGPPAGTKGSKPNLGRVRTWKDRTGQFKVEAEFLGLVGNKIRLHKMNGVTIEVPLEKMAAEDKAYITKALRGDAVDDNTPLSAVRDAGHRHSNSRSNSRPEPTRQPSKPPRKHTDWFEFFLNAGCDMDDCTRYGNNFDREKIEESILSDLQDSNLRTLGLREGDILRVLKFIREKYGPPPTPDKGDREAKTAADAAIAKSLREPTPPPPNLFTSADGTLKQPARRGRPSVSGRQASTAVDSNALGAAAAKLNDRGVTPPISRVASPPTMKADPIDKRSSSTIPQTGGGFDDDAWTPRGPATPAPAPAPAPAPVVAAPAPSPAPPAPTPIQPPTLAPRPGSTGPPSSGLTYNDGLLAQLGLGAGVPRPPSAPAMSQSYSSGAGSFHSPSPNPNGPRGPIAPIAQNQSLLAPLISTPTGFRPQFSQAPLMPNMTGYPMQQQLQPNFTGMPMQQQQPSFLNAPIGMQPTGSPNFMQSQPTGQPSFLQQQPSFLQQQPTGFMQPQPTGFQPGFVQRQPTGFMQQQPTGFQQSTAPSYNQLPARGSPIQFNPLPPTSSGPPATSTATAQFQPNNIFASMKDGSFASGKLGPQDPGKYDALRPQPTGMPFGQLQPQQTGFPGGMMQPQMTGFPIQQQPVFQQQTGFQQQYPRQF